MYNKKKDKDIKEEEKKGAAASENKKPAGKKIDLSPLTEDEIKSYLEWEDKRIISISNQIVEFFPRVMFFHTIIVAMCAIRSPTDLCVAATYFAMLMRIIMVFGYYANK